ncbi:MAG: hypothetical protein J5486_03360 [Bacteroidaceae bacterium]|nr:hypothetical protein [Bacteroidaceae bacterium]
MNKKRYIQPSVSIVMINQKHSILTLSGGEDGLHYRGTTSDNDITEAGAKQSTYDVWGDDWSK